MSTSSAIASRFSIINWINDTLLLPMTKIEELGAGNVYCQLLDAAYPDRVPLHKVKWEAKLEVDFLHNFKVLTTSFEFLGIEKKIDIQKLAKAKYQDNLEFIQWLKAHVEDKIDYVNYEPLKRRNFSKVYLGFVNKVKFNVTLNSINKQNMDNSYMKSSIKSNATMKSSAMVTSRSSACIITKPVVETKPVSKAVAVTKPVDKRKSIGPISFISLSSKGMTKNQSSAGLGQKNPHVKNVEVIESEGSQDEFF